MEGKVNINGIEVKYFTHGEGTDIVLLHGWGCDHTIWRSIVSHLEPGFRVTVPDLPGFGESSEPAYPWNAEDYVKNLEGFLSHLGISNPILMGHSHGGRVSLLYASRNPVHKLILVDAAGIKPRRTLKYYLKVYSFKAMKRLAPLLVGRSRAEQLIDAHRKRTASADYLAASEVMRATMSRLVNQDMRHVLPLIQAPTLLIWGEKDTATPLEDAKTMEKLIPDAGLCVLEGTGHYSFCENPYAAAKILQSFI